MRFQYILLSKDTGEIFDVKMKLSLEHENRWFVATLEGDSRTVCSAEPKRASCRLVSERQVFDEQPDTVR